MDGNRLSNIFFENNKVEKMNISVTLEKNVSINETINVY